MKILPGEGVTLRLELPPHAANSAAATEKWLLSLWQASHKSNWRLWRNRVAISLEYLATEHFLTAQVYVRSRALADVTRSLLKAHFPRIEVGGNGSRPLPDLFTSQPGAVRTFGLSMPGWFALAPDATPEGVAALLASLAVRDLATAVFLQLLLEPTWMTTDSGRQPAFWLAGRLLSTAPDQATARHRLTVAAAAFGQFAGTNTLSFAPARPLRPSHVTAALERRWPRRLLPAGHPATAAQVAALFHPPAEPSRVPGLEVSTATRTPVTTQAQGILIGEGRDRFGRPVPLRIAPSDLLRHALVVGPSGTGKSTLLAILACELVAAGCGITVIDPHGGLARAIARSFPEGSRSRAAMLRFADAEHPVSLNPLATNAAHGNMVADELVDILQRIAGRYWGPMLDLLLRHAALATIEIGGSLSESARLLQDASFRERVLPGLRNEETARFLGELGDAGAFDRRVLPAVHRLQRLFANPWLRNILAQSGNALDYGSLLDRGETLLCDLSGIGTGNARLIGSLLLLMVRQGMFNRRAAHAPHIVLIDEASWFLSPTVAELLDQARKFGVGLILAVQRFGQLTPADVRDAVMANAGTNIIMRIQDHDEASLLHRHLASERLRVEDLQRLPRYEAYARLTVDGERHEPAWVRTPPPATGSPHGAEREQRLLLAGRRFTRPRAVVEAELDRHARLLSNDDPEIRSLPLAEAEIPADAA